MAGVENYSNLFYTHPATYLTLILLRQPISKSYSRCPSPLSLEVDDVFNILYKTVIIITATYHHQMSRCISVPGPWRQSDGPTSNIGYGLQIRRSNDTSSNIVSIRMFHAHQSVSSSSASSSKLMYDISRKLPAANHTEGEVSLSLGRHWDWLRLRKWYGVELSSAAAGRGGWTLGTAAAVNGMDAN